MSIVEILPSNRTRLEEGFLLAFDNLLNSVEAAFPDLLNAKTCPDGTLLLLANDRGVSDYELSDSEDNQRSTIDNAWLTRMLAGTEAGLDFALDTLDYESQLTPWYKQEPVGSPYELEVTAWERGNKPVDVDKAHRLEKYLYGASNERDELTLTLAYGVEESFIVSGGAALQTTVLEVPTSATLGDIPTDDMNVFIAGGAQACTTVLPMRMDTRFSDLPLSVAQFHIAGAANMTTSVLPMSMIAQY
jgi:phage tail P2-like protein